MKDDRFRAPVDDAYVEALGRAAYVFARLEWNAVWCCERMQPNYIRNLKRKTAGIIADNLVRLIGHHPGPTVAAAAEAPAREFKRLVGIRNAILHGNPGTALTGEQRLFRNGQEWTIDMVNDAADEFVAGSLPLNALLYNELK